MQKKVSMVMPVYNKLKYIDMMLESVYNQNWDNIELIMINDGATDGTRERLSEWEPKFRQRGYDVVIVDQENMGIPGAVKSGLLRVTGDYLCLVDCDDKLEPEYVSAMAGWLDKHPADQLTVCPFNTFTIKDGVHSHLSTFDTSRIPSRPLMMEKYLSGKYITMVWIYMVRTSYFRMCNVIENYATDIRSTQEPGFILPLIAGGGPLKIIPAPLYNYNIYDGQTTPHRSVEAIIKHLNGYRDMAKRIIDTLDIKPREKQSLKSIADLAHKKFLIPSLQNLPDGENYLSDIATEAAKLINELFYPNPEITAEEIVKSRYSVLSTLITNCILGERSFELPAVTGRVIGCGALGKVGQKYIPEFKGTSLEPTDLWDRCASPGDSIIEIPVTTPDFNTLTPEDVVLVFPFDQEVKNEMINTAKKHGAKKIISGNDILACLAALQYPQFYGECRFIG